MENKVRKTDQTNVQTREINVITAEIKNLRCQAQSMALLYTVEIGRRLVEAKQALPHGKWGDWLKNEVEFSQSTANNFMRLYEEYGSAQISFFGASVNSQSIANLPYSKALQLLAIPQDERETFVQEVKAEDLSVSELKAAIEERNQARKEAEQAKAREQELAQKLETFKKATETASIKNKETEDLRKRLEEMTANCQATDKRVKELTEKLKKAESDPQIPPTTLNKIRQEANEAAKQQAENAASKALEEAKKKIEAAEAAQKAAQRAEQQALEDLKQAQNRLKTASPEITAFKTLFDSMQDIATKLRNTIKQIDAQDPETANKLRNALKAFGAELQQDK